jgi:hypothetical protein
MANQHICVAIYTTHAQADEAFSRLEVEGFDMSLLSFAGRDYWADMVGSRQTRGRFTYQGKYGAFWERLWAILPDWGIFCLFETGPLLVAGPLARGIVAGLANEDENGNAGSDGRRSDFETGLCDLGVPMESVVVYEKAVMNDQILLFVFGSVGAVVQAQRLLNETKAINHTLHHAAGNDGNRSLHRRSRLEHEEHEEDGMSYNAEPHQ